MRRTDKKKTFGQQSSKVTQLADTLSQAISMKKFREGDSLPSINQLSAEYGVSRDTVFKAFLDLRERGLIDSTPGKGYYVTSQVTNVLLLLDACRQVMLETEKRFKHPMRILLFGKKGIYEMKNVGALLPLSFDASSME